MATTLTPFKRSSARKSNIFELLPDSDDEAPNNSVTGPISVDTPQPGAAALGEVTTNKVKSPAEDLADRLDDFHIVTPTRIIKARGLKTRRSIFDNPAGDQENFKSIFEDGRAGPSGTVPEGKGKEPEDNFVRNILSRKDSDKIPVDSTQLAKHRAGKFEYVLSLPALDDTADNTSSDKAPAVFPEIKTVLFGCNFVRAYGSSELPRRDRSDSGNTYTLIATPLEGDEKTTTPTTEEQVAEKADDMATATVVETPQAPMQSAPTEGQIEHVESAPTEISLVIRAKSAATTEVAEVESVSPVPDEPATEEDARVPGLVRMVSPVPSPDDKYKSGIYHPNGYCWHPSRASSEAPTDERSDVIDEIITFPAAPHPCSDIAASVEALDKLDEHLDSMDKATEVDNTVNTIKQIKPAAAKPATKPATKPIPGSAARAATVGRSAGVRHSMAGPPSKDANRTAATQAAANKRLSVVSRPASLAPPKPLARSSKPPTTSTFELPGEAVAQRLKEKRLARLSMSMPPSSSTQTPGPGAGRTASPTKSSRPSISSKPPTRPNFELPGEAISRRKREEREAKLKAEAEEERKRREFKARPIRRSSVVQGGGTFPRQTAASLARMKATTEGSSSATTSTVTSTPTHNPTSAVNKRHSTIGHGMSSRPSLAGSSLSRGRVSVVPSSPSTSTAGGAGTRATSTSTGSVRGSASVSAEEAQQQKLRGKEIFKRESSFVSDKERERRSREEAARRAREEAAERSRMLSRAWAENQKRKKAAVAQAQ